MPFISIGADHGIEQENRALKVLGGIKWIANSSVRLEEYFALAAEMSNIANFCEKFGITEDEARKQENHYQLLRSKNRRIQDNVGKISEMIHTYHVGFDGTDGLSNILTKKVLPQPSAVRSLDVQETGEEKYECFVKERI